MANEGATTDPGGQQPDFKKGWEAATQFGALKPADQSETATPATAPEPASEEFGQAKGFYGGRGARGVGCFSEAFQ